MDAPNSPSPLTPHLRPTQPCTRGITFPIRKLRDSLRDFYQENRIQTKVVAGVLLGLAAIVGALVAEPLSKGSRRPASINPPAAGSSNTLATTTPVQATPRSFSDSFKADLAVSNPPLEALAEEPPQSVHSMALEWAGLTEANIALRSFPEQLEGAGDIKKYETPDAAYCLVHILQAHLGPPYTVDNYQRITNVEEDVYHILKQLASQGRVSEVHVEGLSKAEEEFIRPQRMDAFVNEYLDRCLRYAKIAVTPANREKFKYLGGGEFVLAKEISLKLSAAEKQEVFDKAVVSPRFSCAVLDAREDACLDVLTGYKGPVYTLVYGFAHSFAGTESFTNYKRGGRPWSEDNIHKWNDENPDKKFSLIEIVPASLGKE